MQIYPAGTGLYPVPYWYCIVILFFPTVAADSEECERFHMVSTLGELLAERRIKLHSADSVAGQAWLNKDNSIQAAATPTPLV